jgi:hypothetical protein
LIVNTTGLGIRNNVKPGNKPGALDGYLTDIQNLVFSYNTVVAGPNSKAGISLVENPQAPPIVRGVFENNLFVLDNLDDARAWRVFTPGVVFRNNAFTTAMPAQARGEGHFVVPLEALTNPLVSIIGTAAGSDFNLDNYRPTADGPLREGNFGALRALVIEPPDPPEEPEPPEEPVVKPDWEALLEPAAAVGVQLATMAEANGKRRALLEQLQEAEAVFSLAQEQAKADLGELVLKLFEYKQAANETRPPLAPRGKENYSHE